MKPKGLIVLMAISLFSLLCWSALADTETPTLTPTDTLTPTLSPTQTLTITLTPTLTVTLTPTLTPTATALACTNPGALVVGVNKVVTNPTNKYYLLSAAKGVYTITLNSGTTEFYVYRDPCSDYTAGTTLLSGAAGTFNHTSAGTIWVELSSPTGVPNWEFQIDYVAHTYTPTATATKTPTVTLSPTLSPTLTTTLTPTLTPTLTITLTPTLSPTLTLSPTVSPTATVTPTNTRTPTVTPSRTPTLTPIASAYPGYCTDSGNPDSPGQMVDVNCNDSIKDPYVMQMSVWNYHYGHPDRGYLHWDKNTDRPYVGNYGRWEELLTNYSAPTLWGSYYLWDTTSGDSPFLMLRDGHDEYAVMRKRDEAYLEIDTTESDSGINLITGNLMVGDGTADVTMDGEDAYVEGTLEIDGNVRSDSDVDLTATGGSTSDPDLSVAGFAKFAGDVELSGAVYGSALSTQFSSMMLGYLHDRLTAAKLLVAWIKTPPDTESDWSTNGHSITYNGTMTSADKVHKGFVWTLDLDGTDDYLSCADHADFTVQDTGTAPMSIGIWCQVVATTGQQVLMSKWNEATGAEAREWRLSIDSSEKVFFEVYDESGNKTCSTVTDAALAAGWHFIVLTYDGSGGATALAGSNCVIYVDGTAVAETPTNDGAYTQMRDTTASLNVGSNYGTAAQVNFFTGDLGYLFFSTEELSAATVYKMFLADSGYYNLFN